MKQNYDIGDFHYPYNKGISTLKSLKGGIKHA